MCILHGVVEQPGGNQPGGVRHVYHQYRTYLVGYFAHPLVVPLARVGRAAADDKFRAFAQGDFFHLVVVHPSRFLAQVVFQRVVQDARTIDGGSVRQVSAVGEIQSQELVAGIEAGQEHGRVGLRPRVRLHVGPFRPENLLKPFDGEAFTFVHHLAAAVVTLAGVAFGILVRQHRTHGFHHLVAHEVFGRNQFDSLHLPLPFAGDDVKK